MSEISLNRLNPESLLTCEFEYRKMDQYNDEGIEEYFIKINGVIIDSQTRSESEDNKSWFEVSLLYQAFVFDSPFCETHENFQSELEGVYLRAVTKRKRENYLLKIESKSITQGEFIIAGSSAITSIHALSKFSTDHDLF